MKKIDWWIIDGDLVWEVTVISPKKEETKIKMDDYLLAIDTANFNYRKDYYNAVVESLPKDLPLKIRHYLVYW